MHTIDTTAAASCIIPEEDATLFVAKLAGEVAWWFEIAPSELAGSRGRAEVRMGTLLLIRAALHSASVVIA